MGGGRKKILDSVWKKKKYFLQKFSLHDDIGLLEATITMVEGNNQAKILESKVEKYSSIYL
jgi:hypothetical protein